MGWNWGGSHAEGHVQEVRAPRRTSCCDVYGAPRWQSSRLILGAQPLQRPAFAGKSGGSALCTQVIPETASIESKGKEITRKGTEDNPAVVVENDKPGGNPVIKKASELHTFKEVRASVFLNLCVSVGHCLPHWRHSLHGFVEDQLTTLVNNMHYLGNSLARCSRSLPTSSMGSAGRGDTEQREGRDRRVIPSVVRCHSVTSSI